MDLSQLPVIVRPMMIRKADVAADMGVRPDELSRILRGYKLTPTVAEKIEASVKRLVGAA